MTSKVRQGCTTTTEDNREPAILDGHDTKEELYKGVLGFSSVQEFEETMQKDFKRFVQSTEIHKGFYIGRYETSSSGDTVKSVQGAYPLVGNRQSINWYSMYKQQKEYASKINEISVTSHTIWGAGYDAMLNWALKGNDKEKVTSTDYGNYSGNIATTGSEEFINDRINNVCDLAGNIDEISMQTYEKDLRAGMGGHYSYKKPASNRFAVQAPEDISYCDGCRFMLII